MPMIVSVLNEAGESLRSLDAVAVTVGPGAFTGIRIGLATARGIGLAAGIPIIGITTFSAVAAAIPSAERGNTDLLVLLDSKRGDVFAQFFSGDLAPVQSPAILIPNSVAGLLPLGSMVAGDGVALVRPHLATNRPDVRYAAVGGPDAIYVARVAARLIATGGGLPPEPLYLRAADVQSAVAGETIDSKARG